MPLDKGQGEDTKVVPGAASRTTRPWARPPAFLHPFGWVSGSLLGSTLAHRLIDMKAKAYERRPMHDTWWGWRKQQQVSALLARAVKIDAGPRLIETV